MNPLETDALDRLKRVLMLRYPFFGSVLNQLSVRVSGDGQNIEIGNEGLIIGSQILDASAQSIYLFCKFILRVALDHGIRGQKANRFLWNMASELTCNSILLKDGIARNIPGLLYLREVDGWSVEEVYAYLCRKSGTQTNSGNMESQEKMIAGLAESLNLNRTLISSLETQEMPSWSNYRSKMREIVKRTAALAAFPGQNTVAEIIRFRGRDARLKIFDSVLENLIGTNVRKTLRKPDRKYSDLDIILPSDRLEASQLVVAIDVSASIPDHILEELLSEAAWMVSTLSPETKIRVIQVDADIRSDHTYSGGQIDMDFFTRTGRGGTDFTVLFETLGKEGNEHPLIVMTDGNAKVPQIEPASFQVVWLYTYRKLPWGENVWLPV
ncbi:hypothetical protein ApAK_05800 [Thermoplasmatales archaeon AK]|nr:hypothetical protein [Thermoplasmatales archaeon AK]